MTHFISFAAGLALGLTFWAAGRRQPTPSPEKPSSSPSNNELATDSPRDGERAVFIPGRNFEEMLQRLGSDQSMLNVILNSMGEGVLLLNQAGRVVLMNPSAEKILGMPEKEGIGRHYLEVVRHPVLADLLARSKQGGEMARAEIEFKVRDSEEKTFAVSVAAIRAERDNLLGQIMVFSDITSLKRLMGLRTDFVANVSHELKTPLTAILGYVETLLSGGMDDKKNRAQFLEKISAQTQRLHALITDVLELSKIESGAYMERLGPVNLSETVGRVVELLKAKAEARQVSILVDVPEEEKVTAFHEGLLHVVENLVDNAIKFSSAKGEVRVSSKRRLDGWVELSVSDQGLGIPPEAQSRVFERFYRVDPSRSREAGGTGLGLSIVKHLVENMKGEVKLESQVGKGSTFTVLLPVAESTV